MLRDDRFASANTFISAELVHWLVRNVRDVSVSTAVKMAGEFVEQGIIESVVTGNRESNANDKFIYGFALYFFVDKTGAKSPAKSPVSRGVTELAGRWTNYGPI